MTAREPESVSAIGRTAQQNVPLRDEEVRASAQVDYMIPVLDEATRCLVRLSAVICASDERMMRAALDAARQATDPRWVEELILQSYLFAGLPRALNAMREWRRVSGRPAPRTDAERDGGGDWRARGEAACAEVYGRFYDRLRHNIAELHPALDEWMIIDGYGKVLSRDGLDLQRRELCIVAACAAMEQDRQLHSHLHGALHVGVRPEEVDATLAEVRDLLDDDAWDRVVRLWARVRVD